MAENCRLPSPACWKYIFGSNQYTSPDRGRPYMHRSWGITLCVQMSANISIPFFSTICICSLDTTRMQRISWRMMMSS